MLVNVSTRSRALARPTTHTFIRGRGYVDVGEAPQLANKIAPAGRCNPPVGVRDGSFHALVPPGGHPSINFQWSVVARSWIRLDNKSKRLGYSPDYLSQAGWTYGASATNLHH